MKVHRYTTRSTFPTNELQTKIYIERHGVLSYEDRNVSFDCRPETIIRAEQDIKHSRYHDYSGELNLPSEEVRFILDSGILLQNLERQFTRQAERFLEEIDVELARKDGERATENLATWVQARKIEDSTPEH
ncbi:MAG: hypothetical protein Q8P81_00725 [Nanoarchaeota archaeon]|nr:hypothetical protein [Nanoarchaeota archaeon]